jgi:hypothetical protein
VTQEKQKQTDAFMIDILDKLKKVWTMANIQYQTNRIWYFQVEQANATRDLKREHLKITHSTIAATVEAEYELKIEQANATRILHLQQPQPKAIQNLQLEQAKAIQILKHNQIETLQILQNDQIKAIHKLQLEQAEATHKFNCKQAKITDILQPDQANAHIQRMLEKVKNIIVESQPYDQLGLEKLTQEQFNLATQKILDDGKYMDNELVQFVLLLYLTNKIFELDLDLIPSTFKFDNSSIKYFEIVFPMLKNLSKLVINCEHEYEWSLDLIKLLLALPNLLCLELKFTPTNIEFKLPEQKLQINELQLYSDSYDETYNMLSIVSMCPNLINLDLGSNHLNNKYLDKLAETLSQCYNLTNLKLSCIHNLSEDEEDEDDKILHFEKVISQCPNLIKLELSSNNIEYKEINKIAKLLSKSTTLFHLDISGNNIGDEETKEIKKILSQCQTLKELLL